MPFRDVTLPDGTVVRARVSDQAIKDWLDTREVVRNQHGLDRPPDWDDGPTRGWLPHVNDESERAHWTKILGMGDRALAEGINEGPLVTYVWDESVVTKLIVSERGDGSFRVRWRAFPQHTIPGIVTAGKPLVDKTWLTKPDVDIAEFAAFFDDMLARVDKLVCDSAGKSVVPRIVLGHEQPDGPHEDARLDVIAEFGWAEWAAPMLGKEPATA
jgi:hypothetical protein